MIGKRAQRALKHLAVVRPIRGQCAVDAFSKSPQPFVCFAQSKLTSFAEKFQSTRRQFGRAFSHVLPSFESDHVNVPKRNNYGFQCKLHQLPTLELMFRWEILA